MKKIPKHLIDKLIEAAWGYWYYDSASCGDIRLASIALEQATGVWVYSWWNMIGDIITRNGFMPEATDEDIYNVLRAMGFEIIDETN